MSCLEAGHILSKGPKITSLCFSSVATSITCEIPEETEFRNYAKTTREHSSVFFYKRFIWSLWRITTHINLQICTIHLMVLSIGMACCHPLACRFFRKTRCLRPRSRLLTELLNIASQSNHQQSLQLPQEKQKSPTKGRNEVSRVKY